MYKKLSIRVRCNFRHWWWISEEKISTGYSYYCSVVRPNVVVCCDCSKMNAYMLQLVFVSACIFSRTFVCKLNPIPYKELTSEKQAWHWQISWSKIPFKSIGRLGSVWIVEFVAENSWFDWFAIRREIFRQLKIMFVKKVWISKRIA